MNENQAATEAPAADGEVSSPMLAQPLLEPLASRRPVAAMVAERVTRAIAEGRLHPGDRLPSEPHLARELGVGRTSIREAVSQLQARNVVRVVRGRGTYIEQLPEDDPTVTFLRWSAGQQFAIAELLETRIGLEATAVALACVRAEDADLAQLHETDTDHAHATTEDLDELVRTDEHFHQALLRASHNSVLESLYGDLVPKLAEFRGKTLSLPGAPARSAGDHHQIVVEIERRDPHRARSAAVRHLSTLYQEIRVAASGQLTEDPDIHQTLDALA